ncbi:putative nuclease HARBI1 isoform X2 [Cololabis saira]|uniref:putative nuclease HARBI1 isoform X2 n=2 Tax=Cololabis saira TaxID=129043 RepID=UPI002AD4E1E8|nr:putative nuclease HARBI1 isoform X2 [Cololabis saira]
MNSGIGIKFSDGEMPDGWLLGTLAERRYTSAQTKTRNIVERCIGVVKSRFRCIDRSGGVLQYTPEKACKIITSAFILHNICQMYRLPVPNIPDDHPEEDGHDHPAPCETGIQARNDLIRRRFTQAN